MNFDKGKKRAYKKFEGQEELEKYIQTTNKPRFNEFVAKNVSNLVQWSLEESRESHELFSLWKMRFALSFKENDKLPNPDTFKGSCDNVWKDIKKMADSIIETRRTNELLGMKSLQSIVALTKPYQANCLNMNQPEYESASSAHPTTNGDDDDEALDTELFIHDVTYRSYLGHVISDKQIEKLKQIKDAINTGMISTMMKVGAHLLMKQLSKVTLSTVEEALLELSISRMINMMNIVMQDNYRLFFSQDQWSHIQNIVSTMNLDGYDGLCHESSALFDAIIRVNGDIYDVIAFIDEKKYQISKTRHLQQSQPYVMLLIMEHIVRNLQCWSQKADVSKMTFYRRFATILEFIFDSTDVALVDGEISCEATKNVAQLNKAIFIPMHLFFSGAHHKTTRSLNITATLQKTRTNAAILHHINIQCSTDISEVLLTEEGAYVAALLSRLVVPKDLCNLGMVKDTLNCLFKMKTFLLKTIDTLKRDLFKKEISQSMPALTASTCSSRCSSHASHTYLAPKAAQNKKVDTNVSHDDE
ncbi:hypothetical protein INT47_012106 [Mucor saturninus]|uniref:Uncharacterized protein n=1 Tax=Mucor saturninus TaxID=64648 RepID=A0A8H7QQK7_9FUNG|nr:hypothetical protein INT47_012106 [Mucor saturninus]